jgi:hypothetical protein
MEEDRLRNEEQGYHTRGEDYDIVGHGGIKKLEGCFRRSKSEEDGAQEVGYTQSYD